MFNRSGHYKREHKFNILICYLYMSIYVTITWVFECIFLYYLLYLACIFIAIHMQVKVKEKSSDENEKPHNFLFIMNFDPYVPIAMIFFLFTIYIPLWNMINNLNMTLLESSSNIPRDWSQLYYVFIHYFESNSWVQTDLY